MSWWTIAAMTVSGWALLSVPFGVVLGHAIGGRSLHGEPIATDVSGIAPASSPAHPAPPPPTD